jgi:hypothetical protein
MQWGETTTCVPNTNVCDDDLYMNGGYGKLKEGTSNWLTASWSGAKWTGGNVAERLTQGSTWGVGSATGLGDAKNGMMVSYPSTFVWDKDGKPSGSRCNDVVTYSCPRCQGFDVDSFPDTELNQIKRTCQPNGKWTGPTNFKCHSASYKYTTINMQKIIKNRGTYTTGTVLPTKKASVWQPYDNTFKSPYECQHNIDLCPECQSNIDASCKKDAETYSTKTFEWVKNEAKYTACSSVAQNPCPKRCSQTWTDPTLVDTSTTCKNGGVCTACSATLAEQQAVGASCSYTGVVTKAVLCDQCYLNDVGLTRCAVSGKCLCKGSAAGFRVGKYYGDGCQTKTETLDFSMKIQEATPGVDAEGTATQLVCGNKANHVKIHLPTHYEAGHYGVTTPGTGGVNIDGVLKSKDGTVVESWKIVHAINDTSFITDVDKMDHAEKYTLEVTATDYMHRGDQSVVKKTLTFTTYSSIDATTLCQEPLPAKPAAPAPGKQPDGGYTAVSQKVTISATIKWDADAKAAYNGAYAMSINPGFYDATTKKFNAGVSISSSVSVTRRSSSSVAYAMKVLKSHMTAAQFKRLVSHNSPANLIAALKKIKSAGHYHFIIPSSSAFKLNPASWSYGSLYGSDSSDLEWWGIFLIVLAVLIIIAVIVLIVVMTSGRAQKRHDDHHNEVEMSSAVKGSASGEAGISVSVHADEGEKGRV